MIEDRLDSVGKGLTGNGVAQRPLNVPQGSVPKGDDRGRCIHRYPAGSAQRAAVERLTPAECGVLELLLLGNTNSRIAQSRGTTLRTVSKQVDAVYKKLEVHSRGELAQRFGASE